MVCLGVLPFAGLALLARKRHRAKRAAEEAAAARYAASEAKRSEKRRIKSLHKQREKHEQTRAEEQKTLKDLAPEAVTQWWKQRNTEVADRKQGQKRVEGQWRTALAKTFWRTNQASVSGKPDSIMYAWQGEVGARRGTGTLGEAKLRYGGRNWGGALATTHISPGFCPAQNARFSCQMQRDISVMHGWF